MKSHRKSKKTLTTELNAGDRERIATHCPSDMTETVRLALEEEIKNFDASSARRDAETSAAGSAVDAYQDWLEDHEGHEPPEANPDTVPDEDGFKYITSEKDEEVTRLLKKFRLSLPARQLQVWNLVMQHQMSLNETAKLLNISKGVVQEYLDKAKEKFRQFAEEMRHERKG
jgi:RNA polymerase sigma factor (sigma-70 family)